MKVQAQFPQACRAEEAVSAPAEPSAPRAATATSTVTFTVTEMQTTLSTGIDDYVSTIPILPPSPDGEKRTPRL